MIRLHPMPDTDTDAVNSAGERRVYVKTFGCQMNVYDSERMGEILAAEGYREVAAPDEADLVVLNTCHIREKAAEKMFSDVGRLRDMGQARQDAGGAPLTIAVAGCVAQAEGAEIIRRAPAVNLVLGPQSYHRLPQLLADAGAAAARGDNVRIIDTDFPEEDKFEAIAAARRTRGPAAFVTVQEGCDKFCSFCVVPYTRGAEVSRPAQQIIDEVRALAAQGAVEFTLLGQNVNAYHGAGGQGDARPVTLAALLRQLARVDGVARLRYTTSHPRDMTDELIALHGEEPKLMPYLHLPVQAGSNRILKAMNRKHTAESYLVIVDRLRAACPDIALSGDFIVGFPGEREDDFQQTLEIVRAAGYAQAYSFKYSQRPGTPAADAAEQVPEEVKADRLQRLQALISSQQLAFNQACIGQEMTVLMEREGKREGQLVGRSPYMQSVYVDAPAHRIGRFATCRIEQAGPNSLQARLSTIAQDAA